VRERCALEIIQYVVDVKVNVALSRTKLMVVGYQKVGKTSLIEALFPFVTSHPVAHNGQQVRLEIGGAKELCIHTSKEKKSFLPLFTSKPAKILTTATRVSLADGKWSVGNPGTSTVELKHGGGASPLLFTIEDEKDRTEVTKRLRRMCGDERTHGIDIQKHAVPLLSLPLSSPASPSPVSSSPLSPSTSSLSLASPDLTLELSVWDFGGQHEYYNNHHYFLSARSIFLVVWNVVDGERGVLGLEFWLRSLKAHLPPPPDPAQADPAKPLYSIIVVGTHMDELVNPEMTKPLREQRIAELFTRRCDMGNLPFEYVEVSSRTGKSMAHLYERIIASARGHAYMGELIPRSYLRVEEEVMKLRQERRDLPVVDLQTEFLPRFASTGQEEALRALALLHAWGECVHFPGSSLLSKYLVVDPAFLTQDILSALFHPDHAPFFPEGVLDHKALTGIWPQYQAKAEFLLALMEKFEVCFELGPRRGETLEVASEAPVEEEDPALARPRVDFWDRRSIVASYLPEEPPPEVFNTTVWPPLCPAGTSELCRLYTFNIIPRELVSRLLVRLHSRVDEKVLWRTGLFLESAAHGVKVLLRAIIPENVLEVIVRGAEDSLAKGIMQMIEGQVTIVARHYAGITMKMTESEASGDAPRRWWELTPSAKWEKRGASSVIGAPGQTVNNEGIQVFQCYASGAGRDDELLAKLKVALWSCGASMADVEDAYALHNPHSLQAFESNRVLLATRHITSPSLFMKNTWKTMAEAKAREGMIEAHETHLGKFDWNSSEKLKVSLMVQGTTAEAAWRIAQGGFGVYASENDQGWFGKGIYLTSSARYAHKYADRKGTKSKKPPALLICAVAPGNIFPVIDTKTYYGRNVADGFQSHFTIVDFKQFPNSKPLLNWAGNPTAVDELVCFQESQTLPLFLVRLKDKPAFAPTPEKPLFYLGRNPYARSSSFSTRRPSANRLMMTGAGSTSGQGVPAAVAETEIDMATFMGFNTAEVIDHLVLVGVELQPSDKAILVKERINGEALYEFNKDSLTALGLPAGIAALITKRIPRQ